MLFLILFFCIFARADKKTREKVPPNKVNKPELKDKQTKKNQFSKKIEKNHTNSSNFNEKNRQNHNRKGPENSKKHQYDDKNLQKLKAGVEIYKAMYKNNGKQNSNQVKQTNQRNKMFDILDQIRERYAPPTTPVSHFTFTNVFITIVVIALIIFVAYFMISRFFKIQSSEINEEELPLIVSQMNQDQHDLSVHGFSKI